MRVTAHDGPLVQYARLGQGAPGNKRAYFVWRSNIRIICHRFIKSLFSGIVLLIWDEYKGRNLLTRTDRDIFVWLAMNNCSINFAPDPSSILGLTFVQGCIEHVGNFVHNLSNIGHRSASGVPIRLLKREF